MKYALLLARQRSGTGALGSVLDKHHELKYLGEVFHPSNVGQEENFFTYYLKRVQIDPREALPDRKFSIFEEFLAEQSKRYGGRTIIVDVKYRSLHHLNGGWLGLSEQPLLLQRAMQRSVPIIHLTRNNMVETFVSGRLAEANKVWHARKESEVNVKSTVLDIRALSNYLVSIQRELELVREWTSDYSHISTFDYSEMMTKNGEVSLETVEILEKLLAIGKFEDRKPNFKKQAPSKLSDSIENFEIVKHALSGSGFSWMLE